MAQSVLLLVNPFSGNKKGHQTAVNVAEQLAEKGYLCETLTSKSVSELNLQVKSKDLSAYAFVGIIGGDGSMHEFINAALSYHHSLPVPVALFPCGTGNSFNFDIGCASVDETLDCIFANSTSFIDLAEVRYRHETLWSFNILGCGLVAEINALAEKMRFLGGSRYTVASLIKLFANPVQHYKIITDSVEREGRYSFILACNTRYTGKGMMMAPRAKLNDGKFDVILVKASPFWKLLMLFPKIFKGKHIGADILEYVQASTLEVTALSGKGFTNIDGEIKGQLPFTLVVNAKMVTCFVRAEGNA
jgi:diacylglycerol kinase (ATP)